MLKDYKSLACKSVLLLSLFFPSATLAQREPEDSWGPDKKAHAFVSAMVASGMYLTFRNSNKSKWSSFLGSIVITLAGGALKEITDKQVSEKDMVANAAGAFSGSLIIYTFDF